MNIGDIKNKTLMIINEYSKKGVLVTTAKNADYINRMNSFINEAQLEIMPIQRLETVYPLGTSSEAVGNFYRFYFPSDLWAMKEIRLNGMVLKEGVLPESDTTVLIDNGVSGDLSLIYYRYPSEITDKTPDNNELEVKPDAQAIIPYYVAAKVLVGEKDSISTLLLNQFYDKLYDLAKKPKGRRSIINVRW